MYIYIYIYIYIMCINSMYTHKNVHAMSWLSGAHILCRKKWRDCSICVYEIVILRCVDTYPLYTHTKTCTQRLHHLMLRIIQPTFLPMCVYIYIGSNKHSRILHSSFNLIYIYIYIYAYGLYWVVMLCSLNIVYFRKVS